MGWEQKEVDRRLTDFYEGNGLFAKIIDLPAEECFRCGFKILGNIPDDVVENVGDLLDWLCWEEKGAEAVKWARLFGGALVVMLINDGGGIEEPLRLEKIRSVDGLVVYDRSIVRPCPAWSDGSSYTMPEQYQVFSRHGTFTVHASRCLVFRNGDKLPEQSAERQLWPWGIPEAYRIAEALQNTEVAHDKAVRLLEKAIQPVYKVHGLSQLLETTEGEEQVRRRIELLDFSRGLLDTVVMDMEDDFYYRGEVPEGIGKMVDISEQMLSTVTRIPQTVLFGYKQPDHPNNIGNHEKDFGSKKDKRIRVYQHRYADLESWYSYVGSMQNGMVKYNLFRLLSIIFQAEVNSGAFPRLPKFDVEFSPLWSTDDLKQVHIGLKEAEEQRAKAQAAALYVKMGSLKPSEIRKGLFRKSRRK